MSDTDLVKAKMSVFVKFQILQMGYGKTLTFAPYQETAQVILKQDNAFLQKSCLQTDGQTIRVGLGLRVVTICM